MLPVTCPRCFTQNAVSNVHRSLIAAPQRKSLSASSPISTLVAIVCWLEKQNKMRYAAYVGMISCN